MNKNQKAAFYYEWILMISLTFGTAGLVYLSLEHMEKAAVISTLIFILLTKIAYQKRKKALGNME